MIGRAAIENYYRRIAPRLTNYLVATGSDAASASDFVQESFLRLWKLRDELVDDEAQISGLVFTIARNLRRDRFRKDSRLTLEGDLAADAEAANGLSPLARVPAPETAPPMPADDRAYLRRRIAAALAAVPPLLREAYALFQIGELPVREIARRTNVSESLVKVRIFRAKEKLRPLLRDLL